jgi:Polysaccharide deacetylase
MIQPVPPRARAARANRRKSRIDPPRAANLTGGGLPREGPEQARPDECLSHALGAAPRACIGLARAPCAGTSWMCPLWLSRSTTVPIRRGQQKPLDLLASHGARATFFPSASRAAAHPELIARMLREGHAIGLHCGVHVRHSERDVEWLRGDTRSALAQLGRLGLRPTFWRTPWGVTAPWSAQVAQEYGLRLLGWTVDTQDWRGDLARTCSWPAARRSRTEPWFSLMMASDLALAGSVLRRRSVTSSWSPTLRDAGA